MASLSLSTSKLSSLYALSADFRRTPTMPALFVGHGHPMNTLLDNAFTQRLKKMSGAFETPQAILVVSAHWETRGTYVSTNPLPKTIYDFGRFDDRLFKLRYEPKGHPQLAQEVIELVQSTSVQADPNMGLDHGTWTILRFLYPKQDIPVFQLSMDRSRDGQALYQLGQELKPLRKKGVLIIGSGNIVHNLRLMDWHNIDAKPADWNLEFDQQVKDLLQKRAFNRLINYHSLGASAQLSVPTEDHYRPMLFTLGLADQKDALQQLFEGYQYGGISMRCFQIG
ncbi:MAG: 4,5-DOPA dioxygenase extradiol [Bacteroidota bacterium]